MPCRPVRRTLRGVLLSDELRVADIAYVRTFCGWANVALLPVGACARLSGFQGDLLSASRRLSALKLPCTRLFEVRAHPVARNLAGSIDDARWSPPLSGSPLGGDRPTPLRHSYRPEQVSAPPRLHPGLPGLDGAGPAVSTSAAKRVYTSCLPPRNPQNHTVLSSVSRPRNGLSRKCGHPHQPRYPSRTQRAESGTEPQEPQPASAIRAPSDAPSGPQPMTLRTAPATSVAEG